MPGRRFEAFASGEDPPERPADPAVRRANLRRIIRLFGPYRLRLGAVCALIVFSAAVGVISPFLLREVLDVAIPEENVGLLTALVAGMVAIPIVNGVIGVWQTPRGHQGARPHRPARRAARGVRGVRGRRPRCRGGGSALRARARR